MHPSVTVYSHRVLDFIDKEFEWQLLAGDCQFTEGPVWNPAGFYLFSDIPVNCIYRVAEGSKKEVFLRNSGTEHPLDPDLKPDQVGSNALAYDKQGDLLICQHGGHGIARFKGRFAEPFIISYKGMPFNSPNDLIIHRDGRIYFSDPPYGLKDGKLNPEKYQPLAGVYCWWQGQYELICDRYQYPNGVCLSPDQRILYICSNKPFENFVSIYETESNRFLKVLAEETSDGIECDRAGNVYLCNKDGIIILSPEGERMALISLPKVPANICWGGEQGNDLLVTAREHVYLLKGLQK